MRPRASIVRSASSESRYPLRSRTASTISATVASLAVAIRLSIAVRKPLTARTAAAARPASSGLAVASQSVVSSPLAYATSRASEVSPIPRRGRFAILVSETTSAGLSSTCR